VTSRTGGLDPRALPGDLVEQFPTPPGDDHPVARRLSRCARPRPMPEVPPATRTVFPLIVMAVSLLIRSVPSTLRQAAAEWQRSSRDRRSLDDRPRTVRTDEVNRAELADLPRRREALQPADVGLVAGVRRRTSGLRREEVAALVGLSTDYYTRLEQQRGPPPLEQMLAAIARPLRLTLDERDHLFRLAGHSAPIRAADASGAVTHPGSDKD
jgi:hypothetical protein